MPIPEFWRIPLRQESACASSFVTPYWRPSVEYDEERFKAVSIIVDFRMFSFNLASHYSWGVFQFHPVRCLLFVVGILLLISGCSRRTPVSEIDLESSGVSISDPDIQRTDSDWWCWRGPNLNGIATNQELPTNWTSSTNVAWLANIPGRGNGSPIVVDGHVIVATADKSNETQKLIAFDQENGEFRWETTLHESGFTPQNRMHQKSTQSNSTPASDGKNVFISFLNDGKVFTSAVDLNGKQVWQTEVGPFQSKFGYAPSPIVYKSFVIVAADNQGGGHISALDCETGKIAWRITRPAISSYSSPTVATVGGRDQLLISGCGTLTSFNPATGNSYWRVSGLPEATCGTVVTDGKRIFTSGGYPQQKTACFDNEGNEKWTNRTKFYEPSMLVVGDILFGITDDGIANAWDTESGEQLWKERIGGSFSASPVLCNGKVMVSDLKGNTHVFEVIRDRLKRISTNQTGNAIYASLAIADDCIFIRYCNSSSGDDEKLACIRLPD